MLPTKVKRTIERHRLLEPGDRVVVAVSGGPDSVCLLAVLHALSAELGVSLHLAHLDHMFRGEESAGEARFVMDLANRSGIQATVEQSDVPAYCRERGLSPQQGAREVRYAFLRKVARAAGASRIATGHTATDQAETFLMRLVRGAGVSGLSAIPPRRGAIIRPLIDATRAEVLDHLASNKLGYVTDSSNAKTLYTRNRIRMEVLPVLSRFNPRIVETLAAEAALLRDEDGAIEAYLDSVANSLFDRAGDVLAIKRGEFNALPAAFRRRLLRRIAQACGVDPSSLSFDRIDEALSFMTSAPTGRTLNPARGLTISREYDRLVVCAPAPAGPFSHTVAAPGVTAVPELGLVVETQILEGRKNPPQSPFAKGGPTSYPPLSRGGGGGFEMSSFGKNYLWQALFDYDKMGAGLTLRNRRPGDRFRPSGMGGGRKKLQDYLVDEKVPRRLRDSVPLLLAGEHVLWVIGHRTDERFLPGPETKRALFVGIKERNII